MLYVKFITFADFSMNNNKLVKIIFMNRITFGKVLVTILLPVILGGVISCNDNGIMPKLDNEKVLPDDNSQAKQNWVDINSSNLSIRLDLNNNATKHLEVGITTGNGASKNTMLDYAGLKEGTVTKLALAVCYYDDASKKMKPVAYGIVNADVKAGNKLHYAGNLSKMNTANFNEWNDKTKVTDPNKKWYLVGITLDKETETDLENPSKGVVYGGENICTRETMTDLPGDYNQGVFPLNEKIILKKAVDVKTQGKIKMPFYMPYTEISVQWSQQNGRTTAIFNTPKSGVNFKPVGVFANIRFKNYLQKNVRFIPNKDIFIIYRTKAFATKGIFNILGENGTPNGDVPVKTDTTYDICYQVNTGNTPETINSAKTSNTDNDYLAWIVPTGVEDNYSCVIKSANQKDIYTNGQNPDNFSFIELQGQKDLSEFTPNRESQLCMYTSATKLNKDNIGKSNVYMAAINSDVIISEIYHCAYPIDDKTNPDSVRFRNQSLFEFYNPTINKINLSDYGVVRSLNSTATNGVSSTYTQYAYSKGSLETTVMYSLKDEYEWYSAYYVGNGATPEKDNLVDKVEGKTVSFGEDKFMWAGNHNWGINYIDNGYGNKSNVWRGFDPGKTAVLLTQQCTNWTNSPWTYQTSMPFAGSQGKNGAPSPYSGFFHSKETIVGKNRCQSIQTCALTLGGNQNPRYPVWEWSQRPDSPTSATMQHGSYDGYALLKRITYKEKDTNGGYKEVRRYVIVDVYGPSTPDAKIIYSKKLMSGSNSVSGMWNIFVQNIESVVGKGLGAEKDNKYDRYWATRKDGADLPSIYFNSDNWDYAVSKNNKTGDVKFHNNFNNGTPTIGYRYDGQDGLTSKSAN